MKWLRRRMANWLIRAAAWVKPPPAAKAPSQKVGDGESKLPPDPCPFLLAERAALQQLLAENLAELEANDCIA